MWNTNLLFKKEKLSSVFLQCSDERTVKKYTGQFRIVSITTK